MRYFFFFYLLLWGACTTQPSVVDTPPNSAPTSVQTNVPISSSTRDESKPQPIQKQEKVDCQHCIYPWYAESDRSNQASQMLVNCIAPPAGFQRSTLARGSYGEWLRHLPLQAPTTPVLLYNGQLKGRQDVHAAVVDIDVGKRDLQQCADAVMRLRAEYLYSKKRYSKIHFNYTSGDQVSFDDWRQGRKPKVQGNRVHFSPKSGKSNNSYPNFKAYLQQIFNYAGTASLSKELATVPLAEMQIGDVFIQGGFPGHAVLVVDMVVNEAGEKRFLLAQSYMPAQNIHILKNHSEGQYSPWYPLDFETTLRTPEWTFGSEQLHRFGD